MILKRGDPVTWLISTFFALFGGVYFPVAILPRFLQLVVHLLPIIYSLRALRLALLQGYSLKALASDGVILLIFSILLLPISIILFKYAVRKAKEDGSLVYY